MKKEQSTLKLIGGIIFVAAVVILVAVYGKSTSTDGTAQPTNSANVQEAAGKTTIANAPYIGDKSKAKVAIVEYSDFECPFCKKFFDDTFVQLKTNYVETSKVIFVYRNLPLEFHLPAAETDANAALCVFTQKGNDAYFKMADLIYQNSGLNGKGITNEKLTSLAGQAGANEIIFSACLTADQFKDQIQTDKDAGTKAGITGTPSFVVGTLSSDGSVDGEVLVGAQPYATFESTINKYLK